MPTNRAPNVLSKWIHRKDDRPDPVGDALSNLSKMFLQQAFAGPQAEKDRELEWAKLNEQKRANLADEAQAAAQLAATQEATRATQQLEQTRTVDALVESDRANARQLYQVMSNARSVFFDQARALDAADLEWDKYVQGKDELRMANKFRVVEGIQALGSAERNLGIVKAQLSQADASGKSAAVVSLALDIVGLARVGKEKGIIDDATIQALGSTMQSFGSAVESTGNLLGNAVVRQGSDDRQRRLDQFIDTSMQTMQALREVINARVNPAPPGSTVSEDPLAQEDFGVKMAEGLKKAKGFIEGAYKGYDKSGLVLTEDDKQMKTLLYQMLHGMTALEEGAPVATVMNREFIGNPQVPYENKVEAMMASPDAFADALLSGADTLGKELKSFKATGDFGGKMELATMQNVSADHPNFASHSVAKQFATGIEMQLRTGLKLAQEFVDTYGHPQDSPKEFKRAASLAYISLEKYKFLLGAFEAAKARGVEFNMAADAERAAAAALAESEQRAREYFKGRLGGK